MTAPTADPLSNPASVLRDPAGHGVLRTTSTARSTCSSPGRRDRGGTRARHRGARGRPGGDAEGVWAAGEAGPGRDSSARLWASGSCASAEQLRQILREPRAGGPGPPCKSTKPNAGHVILRSYPCLALGQDPSGADRRSASGTLRSVVSILMSFSVSRCMSCIEIRGRGLGVAASRRGRCRSS